jgi:N6-L-threonylcarbamoyladenine synthase
LKVFIEGIFMAKNLVLGIESSCDETSVAVVEDGYRVLSNEVATQIELHNRYGGVVPEVASRQHLESLPILIPSALKQAQVAYDDLSGIAVTASPGLIGALLIGLSAAKGLALSLKIPFVAIHHIEAHLYAARLNDEPVLFPAIGLVVSGGHTELYHIEDWGVYRLLASTRDDAAGEAYDKVAKMMGLGYPGGPLIEKLAQKHQGAPGHFSLSRMKDHSQDFSFSGLKTAASLEFKKNPPKDEAELAHFAAKFQNTVIEEIILRVRKAMFEARPKSLLVGGGVACNQAVRDALKKEANDFKAVLRVPPPKFCSDNAAMIAGLGAHQLASGKMAPLSATANPTGSFY